MHESCSYLPLSNEIN